MARGRRSISFRSALIVAACIVLGYLAISISLRNNLALRTTVTSIASPLVDLLAAAGMIYAAGRSDEGSTEKTAWSMIAAAQISYMLGDIAWAVLEVGLKQPPYPSVADGFYMIFYILFAASIMLLPSRSLTSSEKTKFYLDIGIVMITAILIFWAFLIGPIINGSDPDTITLFLSFAYPFMDMLMLFALMELLLKRLPVTGLNSLMLLAVSALAFIVTDIIFTIQTLNNTYVSGDLIDAGWYLSFSFIWLAGVLQANSQSMLISKPAAERSNMPSWPEYIPYLGVCIAFIFLVWSFNHPSSISFYALLWGIGGIIGLVLIRQIIALNENRRLYSSAQQEIKERSHIEKALKASEERFRTIFETALDSIFIKDRESRYIHVNPAMERLFNSPASALIGKTDSELFGAEDAKHIVDADRKVLDGMIIEEEHTLTVNGNPTSFHSIKVPIYDSSGNITSLFGITRDVTERRRSQEELRESKDQLRRLTDSMLDMVSQVDVHGVYQYVSPSHKKVLGYEPGELLGRPCFEFLHQEDQANAEKVQQYILSTRSSKSIECRYRHKDGHYLWLESAINPLLDNNGIVIGGIISTREITDRIRAEEALRESQRRLADIINFMPDATLVIDSNGKVIAWNQAIEAMTNIRAENILGKGNYEYAIPFYGERRPILIDLVLKPQEPFQNKYDTIERQGGSLIGEAYMPNLKGGSLYLLGAASALYDSEGRISGAIECIKDITDRRHAEEQLSSSLREKEVLLKEVHHRVKNNLQVISSLLNLQSGHIEDKNAREAFAESRDRIRTMALIHEILYKSDDLARIDFSEYVRNLAGYLLRSYRSKGMIVDIRQDLDHVLMDIDKSIPCGLIINELVSNSMKHAFKDGRRGEIHIALRSLDDHRLEMSVADNGVGLPSDLKIENTKSLGLKLVSGLVNQIKGTMEINRDGGTEFKITFPG